MQPSVGVHTKGLSSELLEFGVPMDGLQEWEEACLGDQMRANNKSSCR